MVSSFCFPLGYIILSVAISMKSTKVQTLGAVALHAITACTDYASIIQLSFSLVCLALSCMLSTRVCTCTHVHIHVSLL